MGRKLCIGLLLAIGIALAEAQAQTETSRPQVEETEQQTGEAPPKGEAQAQVETARPQDEGMEEQTEEARETTEASPDESGAVEAQPPKDKVISGMSILGNQEAPKSLVIVPWKRSEIGDAMDISTMLDDSRQPVDREVFLRALRYYEIRSETKP